METFLGIILSIIIGFYLLGILGRFLLKYWINKKMKQFGGQAGKGGNGQFYGNFGGFNFGGGASQQNRYTSDEQGKKPEGKVTVSKSTEDHKRINDKVGDYVDFEEVK